MEEKYVLDASRARQLPLRSSSTTFHATLAMLFLLPLTSVVMLVRPLARRLPAQQRAAPAAAAVAARLLTGQIRGSPRVVASEPAERLTLDSATPADWARVVEILSPFMKDNRVAKLEKVAGERRGGLHVVLENVHDPYNAAAVLRTAEGLGLQHVHVIESVGHCDFPSFSTPRRSIDNVAMGASRWLSLRRYSRTNDCLEALRAEGVRIYASDCPPAESDGDDAHAEAAWHTNRPWRGGEGGEEGGEEGGGGGRSDSRSAEIKRGAAAAHAQARPIRDISFAPGETVALVFGNERRGVSAQFAEKADGMFYLPMSGFTQSFNISVAAAMALHAAVSSGAFPDGSLTDDERNELLGRWLLRDVKAARPILRSRGVEFVDY